MPTITPTLWYSREAEEAAKFYASIFPNSRIDRVTFSANESIATRAATPSEIADM